jgi:hypothetical protein
MCEARRRDEWGRTSGVLAMLYNVNRGPRQPSKRPSEFDPTQERKIVYGSIEELKVFVKPT